MSKLDKQYTDLLQDIIDNGVTKQDRTGTGTLSVFGRQIRHKMSEGFPLLTTKKMPFKTITTELLWFLRGDTNIKFLVDNNCHIWDGDAYQSYLKRMEGGREDMIFDKETFVNEIKNNDKEHFWVKQFGELGPIYGKQWRSWETYFDKSKGWMPHNYDQIQNLINDLKTNPDSRRLMVNAWNVGELDQMTLPPCHYGFQVYTRELSIKERMVEYKRRNLTPNIDPLDMVPSRAISLMWNQRSVDTFLGLPFNIASYGLLLEIIAKSVNMVPDELIGNLGDTHLYLNHIEQAKEQIGRKYSSEERHEMLKTAMSDFYKTAVDEQVPFGGGLSEYYDSYKIPYNTREPYALPMVKLSSGHNLRAILKGNFDEIEISDIMLMNYQSHPSIKAPLSN
jgi:thymidylate synthase